MTLILPIDAGLALNNNRLTDHNRSPIDMSSEKIGNSQRMANGTLRRIFIAEKFRFKVDWKTVPHLSTKTVDGFWGANDMKTFYLANNGAFELKITRSDNSTELYTVMFESFERNLLKRSEYVEFWDVNMTLVEV